MKNLSLQQKLIAFSISFVLLVCTSSIINTINVYTANQKAEREIKVAIGQISDVAEAFKHVAHLKKYQQELTTQYHISQRQFILPEHFAYGVNIIRKKLSSNVLLLETNPAYEKLLYLLPGFKAAQTSLEHFLASMENLERQVADETVDNSTIQAQLDSMTADTIVLENIFDTIHKKSLENLLITSNSVSENSFFNWILISVITILISIIITFVAAWWVFTKVITPITIATAAAEKVRNGNYNIEIETKDYEQTEIGIFLHAIQSMAQTIKSQISKFDHSHRQTIEKKEELAEISQRLEKKLSYEALLLGFQNIFFNNTDNININLDHFRQELKTLFKCRWSRRLGIDNISHSWYSSGDLLNENQDINGLTDLTTEQISKLRELTRNKEPLLYNSFEDFSDIAGFFSITKEDLKPSECIYLIPTHITNTLVAMNCVPMPREIAHDFDAQETIVKVTMFGNITCEKLAQQYSLKSQSDTTAKILNAANIKRWEIPYKDEQLLIKKGDIKSVFYEADKAMLDIDFDSFTTKKAILLVHEFFTQIIQKKTDKLTFQYKLSSKSSQGTVWREIKVLLIKPDDNGPGLLSGIAIDINKEKTALLESQKNTEQLKVSIQQLENTQGQLVETEKQAALGRLVSGVAHEINTPLGLAITYTSFLEDKLTALMDDYNNGVFKRSSFDDFCSIGKISIADTLIHLNRAGALVENFKQIAVDQNTNIIKSFELNEYIHKVVQSIRGNLKNTPYSLKMNYDTNVRISMQSNPGPIMQIITNLVENSLSHGFQDRKEGAITISITQKGNFANILFTDDGNGMDETTLNRIFDPFFTTNMGGSGAGLGSHIVYNLVTHTLKGKISCTSTLGEGTQLTMSIPRVIS